MKNEEKNKENNTDKKTGKYVYDPETGRVVKVSDEIPGLKKEAASSECPHQHHCCDGCCHH